jgi:hypothetical protein
MNSDFPFRAKAGIYALAFVALLSCLMLVNQEAKQYSLQTGQSAIGFYDERFGGLRKHLPPAGIAGYLSDQPAGELQSQAEFTTAQYALAPIILLNSPDQDLVVGNFHTPQPNPSTWTSHGLEPVVNLGNGSWLFRRAGK